MAAITSYWLCDLLILIFSFILAAYLHFRLFAKNYWKNLNIPHLEPKFIVGNMKELNVTKSFQELMDDIYFKNKDKRMVGIWFYTAPVLVVTDLQLMKNILVTDFQHFHDRGVATSVKSEPLTGHLFSLTGRQWRNMRVKLTPTFTSGKMKMMFPTMLKCGDELQNYLKKIAEKKETVEVKEMLARFTTDTIGTCAFGIETNSLKNPDAEFRKYGKKIFKQSLYIMISNVMQALFPTLDKIFEFRRFDKSTSDFFMKAVKETISYREQNNIKRKDFMQLLIELKNKGYVEDVDVKLTDDEHNEAITGDPFTVEQAAAQAFLFFAAGFETSSTVMTFTLYELAKNPEIQTKLQMEIDRILLKHNNEVTYEAMQEMEYLDCVINESLRMYPPAGILFRGCTKEYKVPDTNVVLKKGTLIFIPPCSVQKDEEYFPNPDSFRPERFLPEEKAKRDHFVHLPFGEGPRNCIGSRFGLMQTKVGLLSVLSKYTVEVCNETPIPLKLDPKMFGPSPVNGMSLRINERKI